MQPPFKNILILEDDPASLFLLQDLLDELYIGESIRVTGNGAEALAYMEAGRAASATGTGLVLPDLLLVDISMPVMDGLEFLEKYQQAGYPQLKPTRTIVLTSSTYQRDLEKAKLLGIFAYLVKPVTKGALLFALRSTL